MAEEKVKDKDKGFPEEWKRANLCLQNVADVASHPLMIASSALPRMQCVIDVPNVDTFSQSVDPLQKWAEVHLDSPHMGEAFLGTLTKQGDDPNTSPWAVTFFPEWEAHSV